VGDAVRAGRDEVRPLRENLLAKLNLPRRGHKALEAKVNGDADWSHEGNGSANSRTCLS